MKLGFIIHNGESFFVSALLCFAIALKVFDRKGALAEDWAIRGISFRRVCVRV